MTRLPPTRITFTLDFSQAALLNAAAENLGMSVSYMCALLVQAPTELLRKYAEAENPTQADFLREAFGHPTLPASAT